LARVEDVGENCLACKTADLEKGAWTGVWLGDGEFELGSATGV